MGKTKKEVVKELKKVVSTPLAKIVLRMVLNEVKALDGDFNDNLKDVLRAFADCSKGTVRELIYYTDTVQFFNRYKKDIIDLLESDIQDGLFTIKYVETSNNYYPVVAVGDQFVKTVEYSHYIMRQKLDTYQKNMLAWYGFESVIHRLEEVIQ